MKTFKMRKKNQTCYFAIHNGPIDSQDGVSLLVTLGLR